jgi:site-specific DNA-methyltransferase (adenine-specific)
MKKEVPAYEGESTTGFLRGRSGPSNQHGDSGSVARFFQSCPFTEEDIPAFLYYAKASKSDRGEGNTHSTVKPTSLIRYLCKLITPPGGTILDPFGGSGTTGIAAIKEGFHYILIEQQEEYCEIARKRIAAVPARLDRWAEAGG